MEGAMQLLQCQQIGGDVLADGGVRTTAGFHGTNAFGRQRLMSGKKFPVFAGKDIIGDHGNVHFPAELKAKLEHERGLAAAHGAAHAHGEGALPEITVERRIAVMKMAGMIQEIVGMAVAFVGAGMEMKFHSA